ncbi:MAG: Uma2 family endonuclease, partial [Xenococcaceae cyanobacterium]
MVTTPVKLTLEDYLTYDDGTDNRYELVRGKLVLMTPPSVRHLLIAKFIEGILDDEIARLNLPLVALKEAGVQTELDSSRL